MRRPGGDRGAHARAVRPLTAPLAPLPPGGKRGGPPPPTRGQSPVGGLVALRRRRMDGSLLLRTGARGCGGAAPAIARYDPPGGTSVDDFLHHMLRLGDFAWELRNHQLEQLVREPLSAAARAHRWLPAAEGVHPPPPPRPDKDFVASLRVVNGTLECPPQEGPHPYQDLPGGFSKHLQDALFPPWIIGRGSMTAWEVRIVGEEWAREWSRQCAATRAPETPAQPYAAIPLEGWGPDTRPTPTVIRGAGPDHPWDAATGEWLQADPGPETGWTGDMSSLVRTPVPPRIVLHAANVIGLRRYANGDTPRPPSGGTPQRTGLSSSPWRTSQLGGRYTTTPCPG